MNVLRTSISSSLKKNPTKKELRLTYDAQENAISKRGVGHLSVFPESTITNGEVQPINSADKDRRKTNVICGLALHVRIRFNSLYVTGERSTFRRASSSVLA
jgi:hypothetical protein